MKKSADAFRTIGEVADWLDEKPHVLRFWESKFSQIKPVKRAGGRRYYRPQDMLLIGGIKRLLHEDGMTIKGVQKVIREKGIAFVSEYSHPITAEDSTDSKVAEKVPAPAREPVVPPTGAVDAAAPVAATSAPEPPAPSPAVHSPETGGGHILLQLTRQLAGQPELVAEHRDRLVKALNRIKSLIEA